MDIGRELESLRKRLAAVEHSARLSSASLDDTALQVRDGGGVLRGIVGQQGDGTTAVTIVNGSPPPAPATPTAAPALGGVSAGWAGEFADGAVIPMDWSRVEVHASPSPGFTPTADTLKATIETAQGGIVYIPSTVPLYVALVARNTSGKASAATALVGPYAPKPVAGEIGIGEITETLISDGAITTPKVFANAVTTAKLAAGSVDAVALKADAITGKTITGGTVTGATVTGGVVQTAASGQRVVLNPLAADPSYPTQSFPAVELHSGASAQTSPGLLSAQVIDGSSAYPYALLSSPSVANIGPAGQPITSELRLLSSQPGVRGGSFELSANANTFNDASGSSRIYDFAGKNTADTSALQLSCFDGDTAPGGTGLLGPGTSIDMTGTRISIRARNNTSDRSVYISPTGVSIDGDLAVAGFSHGRDYAAFQARPSATTGSTTEQIALSQANVNIRNGRAYRLRVSGLAVNGNSNTGVRIRIRRTNTSGAIWLDTYTVTTPNGGANYQYNNANVIVNDTGADITTTLVMTWVSVAGGSSFLNAGLGLYTTMEVLDIGAATNYASAQSAT